MMIIGVDYHPSDQYIAFADTETGECGERRLNHSDGEAEKFYRDLQQRAVSVRVGMEATGYSRWFERLLAELGIEVWIGDAAKIKTKRVRKQKTDRFTASCTFGPKYRRDAICIATSLSTSASNSSSSRFRCRATDGPSSRFRKSASLAFCGVGSATLKAPSIPSIDVRINAFHASSDIFIGGATFCRFGPIFTCPVSALLGTLPSACRNR
jgi:hypothetical protein